MSQPFVVGLGGTTRPRSSTELALRYTLAHAETLGVRTELLGADALGLPLYAPGGGALDERASHLIGVLREADGIIIGTPGYHGSMSGLVKNALDYTEEMRADDRTYFDNMPVGCLVTAAGWQAAGSTLTALRAIVHALRGWPTPLGVMINSTERVFDSDGACVSQPIAEQLKTVAEQVVSFVFKSK